MDCLRGIIISADKSRMAELDGLVSQVTSSLALRKISHLPEESELGSMVQTFAPSVVFLDMTDLDLVGRLASLIQHQVPGVQLIGLAAESTHETLLTAVRSGMRDVLTCPLTLGDVHCALARAFEMAKLTPQSSSYRQRIMSFLPAKVGVGASTVALHTAFTLSRFGSARVGLMDLDFDCGVIDFMLKLPYSHGLSDIAEFGSRMDETVWSRVVTKCGNLDVIRSGGPQKASRVTGQTTDQFLRFARLNYDAVCVDLPGTLDESALSVFEQSSSIFIVTTPELASVHLARRRLEVLRQWKLDARAHVILNRWNAAAPLSKEAVEDVLNTEVYATLENNYSTMVRALMNGRPVDLDTSVGRGFTQLANKILGVDREPGNGLREGTGFWATLKNFIVPQKRSGGRDSRVLQLPAPPSSGLPTSENSLEHEGRLALIPPVAESDWGNHRRLISHS